LFLLTRYLPFATMGLLLYHQFQPAISQETCVLTYKFVSWMIAISICLTETILTIRTWALWESNRIMGILLGIYFAITWVPIFMLLQQRSLNIVETTSIPSIVLHSGCLSMGPSHPLFVSWTLLAGFQFVTLMLISVKGYKSFRHNRASGLCRIVYVNGILYYIYIFALSLINLTVTLTLSTGLTELLSFVQHTIQTILTCRMLLDLRQYAKHTMRGDGFTEYTSGFAMPVDGSVFRRNAAAVGKNILDIQPMPSHASLESGLRADNQQLELTGCNGDGAFEGPSAL